MKNGIMSKVKVIMEWVGPRCINKVGSMNCRIRSMSGRTEAASSKGKLIFAFASFDVPLPAKYPNAK